MPDKSRESSGQALSEQGECFEQAKGKTMRRFRSDPGEDGDGTTGRRAWLVDAGRWTAVAFTVGGAAFLSLGRRGGATDCPRPVCSRCGARASCRLPAAQTYREEAARSENGDSAEKPLTAYRAT